jgi:cell wall-associated NlpC family hydrolase
MTCALRTLTALLSTTAALSLAGCASAPVIGVRPTPFPGAPPQRWALSATPEYARAAHDVLSAALALRGTRYQLGGTTPDSGLDCSGLVLYVFGQYLPGIPRTVAEQFRIGQAVARAHVSPGDLLFFNTTGRGASHVGIVVDAEARTFVHAPGTGAVVRLERFDTPYWQRRLLGARRLPIGDGSS